MSRDGVSEYMISKPLTERVGQILEEKGFEVVWIENGHHSRVKAPAVNREAAARNNNALLVEFHMNMQVTESGGGKGSGVYHHHNSPKGQAMARILMGKMESWGRGYLWKGGSAPGLIPNPSAFRSSRLTLIHFTTPPAMIVELDSIDFHGWVTEQQEMIAQDLAAGLMECAEL